MQMVLVSDRERLLLVVALTSGSSPSAHDGCQKNLESLYIADESIYTQRDTTRESAARQNEEKERERRRGGRRRAI